MSDINFKSSLGRQMNAYLNLREKMGYQAERHATVLRCFDRFLCTSGLQECHTIDKAIYDRWLAAMNYNNAATLYHNALIMRMFLQYMNKNGALCYIPPIPRDTSPNYIPYIFTEKEMNKIFTACDKWMDKQDQWTSIIISMPAIIRLLYSTGMRIGEAVTITNRDVDFEKGIIHLYHTKNGRERIAPINSSLDKVLQQYVKYRDRIPVEGVNSPGAYFFVSLRGKRIKSDTVLYRFQQILDSIGIVDKYNKKLPRIHDVRHTSCVHAMHKLLLQGKDLYCHLPMLSTFMGHADISHTEYYLRLTQEYYPELINQQIKISEGINDIINQVKLQIDYDRL